MHRVIKMDDFLNGLLSIVEDPEWLIDFALEMNCFDHPRVQGRIRELNSKSGIDPQPSTSQDTV